MRPRGCSRESCVGPCMPAGRLCSLPGSARCLPLLATSLRCDDPCPPSQRAPPSLPPPLPLPPFGCSASKQGTRAKEVSAHLAAAAGPPQAGVPECESSQTGRPFPGGPSLGHFGERGFGLRGPLPTQGIHTSCSLPGASVPSRFPVVCFLFSRPAARRVLAWRGGAAAQRTARLPYPGSAPRGRPPRRHRQRFRRGRGGRPWRRRAPPRGMQADSGPEDVPCVCCASPPRLVSDGVI